MGAVPELVCLRLATADKGRAAFNQREVFLKVQTYKCHPSLTESDTHQSRQTQSPLPPDGGQSMWRSFLPLMI
jgi:hypothetical protein